MSTRQQFNNQPSHQDEEGDDIVPYDPYTRSQESSSPSQYAPPRQFDPSTTAPNVYQHNTRAQTPLPHSSSHSPTSLKQYALFPGPMRSITPAPGMSYQPSPLVINPSSSPLQPLEPFGSDTPDPQNPGKKANVCHLCTAGFERRFDLKRHMHTHSEQKEFVCPQCKKALARSDSLQRHQGVCKGPRSP